MHKEWDCTAAGLRSGEFNPRIGDLRPWQQGLSS